jgi:hypothetical protein
MNPNLFNNRNFPKIYLLDMLLLQFLEYFKHIFIYIYNLRYKNEKKKKEKGKGKFETNKLKNQNQSHAQAFGLCRIQPITYARLFYFPPWLLDTRPHSHFLPHTLWQVGPTCRIFSFPETRSHARSCLFSISHAMRSALPSPPLGTPTISACSPATVPSQCTVPHRELAATHASAHLESRSFFLSIKQPYNGNG